MREGIEGVGKWTNEPGKGKYASFALGGWTPPEFKEVNGANAK